MLFQCLERGNDRLKRQTGGKKLMTRNQPMLPLSFVTSFGLREIQFLPSLIRQRAKEKQQEGINSQSQCWEEESD